MDRTEPFPIALVPAPIIPDVAFAYFLHRRRGLINGETCIGKHWKPRSTYAQKLLENDHIACLFAPAHLGKIETLIGEAPEEERTYLRRISNFIRSPMGPGLGSHQALTRFLARREDPTRLLETASACFTKCLDGKQDPFRHGIPLSRLPQEVKPTVYEPTPAGTQFLTLPEFKSKTPEEREVVAWRRVGLREARATVLERTHVGVAIGGPEGSGKSTVAATLTDEIQNILDTLRSRPVWHDFALTVECLNLDLATPTSRAIAERKGKDHEALRAKKRPWTTELAVEAAHQFSAAKKRANIVIADLPGGPPDEITEIVAALADVGIVVTKDWSAMPVWHQLFGQLGIILIAQARSRQPHEGFESVVTRYHEGRIIAGRIVGLDRIVRSWDAFLSCLARVLLFDLLPAFVTKRLSD